MHSAAAADSDSGESQGLDLDFPEGSAAVEFGFGFGTPEDVPRQPRKAGLCQHPEEEPGVASAASTAASPVEWAGSRYRSRPFLWVA